MLKREHIKQAIDAIARRDPETGYALDEMLSMGRIRPISPAVPGDDALSGEDFYFRFDDQPATVKKVIFFNDGTVPIEQRLLIRYGEMVEKHLLQHNRTDMGFRAQAQRVRRAGLRFMVEHELDHALSRLRSADAPSGWKNDRRQHLIDQLAAIRRNEQPAWAPASCHPLFQGTVATDTAAGFVRFPFCLETLIQVADINVEFFHVRFLLECLMRGVADHLFACVIEDRIEGLVYITLKQAAFHRDLEIHYIATVSGRRTDEIRPGLRAHKGVGTFLVAGVWMLWRSQQAGCQAILLDSEIGARQFYQSVGFCPRGMSAFVLTEPKGRLPLAILTMANSSDPMENSVCDAVEGIIESQFKILRTRFRRKKNVQSRRHAVAAIKECLHASARERFTRTAVRLLAAGHRKIPEAGELMQYTHDFGSNRARSALGTMGT